LINKVCKVKGLTLCLDRTNENGKIDIFQGNMNYKHIFDIFIILNCSLDPIVDRCSFEIRFRSCNKIEGGFDVEIIDPQNVPQISNSSSSSSTYRRIDIHFDNLFLSLSDWQYNMLYRMIKILIRSFSKEKNDKESQKESQTDTDAQEDLSSEMNKNKNESYQSSWFSWAWQTITDEEQEVKEDSQISTAKYS
jgi:hypothetical protein